MKSQGFRSGAAAVICAVALIIGVGAGYWYGQRQTPAAQMATASPSTPAAAQNDRKVLYYKDPMGKPDYSPEPKKDSMGMDYIPVYDDEEEPAQQQASAATPQPKGGKGRILYYRNPMGQPDTSPMPKKDSMGMDYIPVYEDEGGDTGVVKISRERIQMLGVRSEPAEMRGLTRAIRAVGTVQADERRLYVINTKFDGWIEKLHVNATGQPVRRGQPLMDIYAPELVVAQQEYALAWRSLQDMAGAGEEVRASAKQLADASLQRLRNWDISDDQVRRLQRDNVISRTLTLRSPADGIVMEKMAIEGMRFAAGDPLYRIADLSTVWVIADVFEQDLGVVREGQSAQIAVNTYAGASFPGKVDFIYPTVMQETRTGKVRVVIANPDGRLKPGMYANVAIDAPADTDPMLAVPESAVLSSGTKQTVLIDRGNGRFEPRAVKLGAHADGYYTVLGGLDAGEKVVVSANFLIDAESNLRAALGAFSPPADAMPSTGDKR
jgi:Cu(I)/Ag(I) efflux system membrane fusion protein